MGPDDSDAALRTALLEARYQTQAPTVRVDWIARSATLVLYVRACPAEIRALCESVTEGKLVDFEAVTKSLRIEVPEGARGFRFAKLLGVQRFATEDCVGILFSFPHVVASKEA